MNDLADWVRDSAGNASLRSIAERMDRSPDSLSRWIRRERMPAEAVVEFSRIYHADMLIGAIASGIVDAEDVQRAMPKLLRYASPVQLTAELHRRAGGRISRTGAS